MFYLIVYYNQKMVQINNLWFNSYKEYYREVTRQIKGSGESTLPVIPFSVVVIDEIETQRMAIPKKYHDEFDNLVWSFYNVARSGWFKKFIRTNWNKSKNNKSS